MAVLIFCTLSVNAALANKFEMVVIDSNHAGDCKAAGDLNGDKNADLVVGGMPKEKMTWYRYPDWTKSTIATAKKEFTTDCALGDVDGDGDLDLVVPDGNKGNNLLWFENRISKSNQKSGSDWTRHEIGNISGFIKDVELADFDHDGRLDVAVRGRKDAVVYFQTRPGQWTRVDIPDFPLGAEGMASGDVDGDGFVDLIGHGAWVRDPGKDQAHTGRAWKSYAIGKVSPTFKADVADINGDGKNDVLYSSSERTANVSWFSATTGDPTGAWTEHVIAPDVERAHTLQVADMDGDGDNDVVFGQMHTSEKKLLVVAYNLDGKGTQWRRLVIGNTGLHDGVVVDIGNDGLPDIFGSNWTGNPPVRLWRQKKSSAASSISTDMFATLIVSEKHKRTFGLAFGDVNADGRIDIVSGRFVYLNPGEDLSGDWIQKVLPSRLEAFAVATIDADGKAEIFAQKQDGDQLVIYSVKPKTTALDDWTIVNIGTVPKASHGLGAQGNRIADIIPGGAPEIAISSGDGIYMFEAPADAGKNAWRRIHVSSRPSDEGLAVGDINRDGLPDVAATTGKKLGVEWYQNPGKTGGDWTTHRIGDMKNAHFPDRVELADLNGDGRLDLIVTEENGKKSGAKTYWWEQPASIDGNTGWTQHLLTTQASTHSLDAADIDRDGDIDLITGEHRGDKRTIIWLNDGSGHFKEKEITKGFESHLGTRLYDLDRDGDLDVVSIAWDNGNILWINRNDAINRAPLNGKNPTVSEPKPAATGLVEKLQNLFDRLVN